MWLTTLHTALMPHKPGQGSTHLQLRQALLAGHSELIVHSGLQATYGSPKYSGIHVQAAALFLSLHLAFSPHGEGEQGLTTSLTLGGTEISEGYQYSFAQYYLTMIVHVYLRFNIPVQSNSWITILIVNINFDTVTLVYYPTQEPQNKIFCCTTVLKISNQPETFYNINIVPGAITA